MQALYSPSTGIIDSRDYLLALQGDLEAHHGTVVLNTRVSQVIGREQLFEIQVERRAAFIAAIRRYYPDLDDARLQPGHTGIRPKLSGAGEPAADFVVQGEEAHGVSGLVNLYGIDSPGLTASLAIAERVSALTNRG